MAVDMDETIKLDRRSFEALAADSRVRILKSLAKRRKTLSELAKEIGLSVSTMKEHLDVLVGAGLIIQKDEGRKWKYYELTRKGSSIVEPRAFKVLVLLGFSLLLFLGAGWNFMNAFGAYSFQADYAHGVFMLGGAAAPIEETSADAAMKAMAAEASPEMENALGYEAQEFAGEAETPSEPSLAAMGAAEVEGEIALGESEAGEGQYLDAQYEGLPSPRGEEVTNAQGMEEHSPPRFPWIEAGLLGAALALLAFAVYYAGK